MEAGVGLAGAFCRRTGLADEIVLYQAPLLLGKASARGLFEVPLLSAMAQRTGAGACTSALRSAKKVMICARHVEHIWRSLFPHASEYAHPARLPGCTVCLAGRAMSGNVWLDVATGSGQAASGWCDISAVVARTLKRCSWLITRSCIRRGRIPLRAGERSSLADGLVDLITVAQALHWILICRRFCRGRSGYSARRGCLRCGSYG